MDRGREVVIRTTLRSSLKVLAIVIESRGLIAHEKDQLRSVFVCQNRLTHLAGHPSLYFVCTTFVLTSSKSNVVASSTNLSQADLNSGVSNTALTSSTFNRSPRSLLNGTSSVPLNTSPALLVRRSSCTSDAVSCLTLLPPPEEGELAKGKSFEELRGVVAAGVGVEEDNRFQLRDD